MAIDLQRGRAAHGHPVIGLADVAERQAADVDLVVADKAEPTPASVEGRHAVLARRRAHAIGHRVAYCAEGAVDVAGRQREAFDPVGQVSHREEGTEVGVGVGIRTRGLGYQALEWASQRECASRADAPFQKGPTINTHRRPHFECRTDSAPPGEYPDGAAPLPGCHGSIEAMQHGASSA